MTQARGAAIIAGVLLLSASAFYGQKEQTAGNPQVWGGPHASMVVSGQNVTLQLDCAQGEIMNPLQPDVNGDFSAQGTYTPQRGGPVRKDSPPNDLPATYRGSVHGDTMHLEIVLADKSQQPPPLTLKRGQAGRVVKCR